MSAEEKRDFVERLILSAFPQMIVELNKRKVDIRKKEKLIHEINVTYHKYYVIAYEIMELWASNSNLSEFRNHAKIDTKNDTKASKSA